MALSVDPLYARVNAAVRPNEVDLVQGEPVARVRPSRVPGRACRAATRESHRFEKEVSDAEYDAERAAILVGSGSDITFMLIVAASGAQQILPVRRESMLSELKRRIRDVRESLTGSCTC